VSGTEWWEIRCGMTRAEVADIVGDHGRDGFRWDRKLTLTYDIMPF
jgi:hypothetical protein